MQAQVGFGMSSICVGRPRNCWRSCFGRPKRIAADHLLVQDVFPLEGCTASRFRVDPLFELDCKNFEVLKDREDGSDVDDF